MSEPQTTKTVALRNLTLHSNIVALKKTKKFRTNEEAIRFLWDYYETREATH